MHLSLKPIGPWPVVAVAALIVTGLTIWAYRQRLRGTSGRWRWVALGLRLAAVLLCLLAALRPSVTIDEKKKQDSVIPILLDASGSMKFTDEVGGRSRWEVARRAVEEAVKQLAGKSDRLATRVYRFDNELHDDKPDDPKPPEGRESALGAMLLKAAKDAGKRVPMVILVSDGASNAGVSPQAVAQQLKAQSIPVLTVGVGSADAGKDSSDLAARNLVTGATVFVKNRPEIRGVVKTRGFGGKTIKVELLVEGEKLPVDSQTIKVPEGAEEIPVTGLKYVPEASGERRLTLRVEPQPGELVATNNEVSTYLNVLKGGLKVLYIQGADFSWEPRFITRAIDPAREISTDLKVLRGPAREGQEGGLDNSVFAPGQYDVFILGGISADYLTRAQVGLLRRAVERGAGLMMLGGRSSLGLGGWGSTELDKVLPSHVSPADGEVLPGDEGVKVVPTTSGLGNYVVRLGRDAAESAQIWAKLAPISGYNRLGVPNPNAILLAQAGRDPVMLALDGTGRTIEFGGETYTWARTEREAHARFWRQVILWLAHRENAGEDQIKLKLDARRVAAGQKLELSAVARDARNDPIPDAQLDATFTRLNAQARPEGKAEPIPLLPQGDESRGPIFANVPPGEYEVVVKGKRGGKEIPQATARFMVYQDDRELENPAADPALLRQIAEITGGQSLPAEELAGHLKAVGPEPGEYVQSTDHRLWDNWPFFLLFTTLLTAEWALRKAKGWV